MSLFESQALHGNMLSTLLIYCIGVSQTFRTPFITCSTPSLPSCPRIQRCRVCPIALLGDDVHLLYIGIHLALSKDVAVVLSQTP